MVRWLADSTENFYKGAMLLNNIYKKTRIHFYSLIYISFTFLVYLLLTYSESLLGYIAVPLYIISYIINLVLIIISLIVSKLTTILIILTLLSSLWIVYGLSSELYFDGLDSKVMIPLIMVAIISNLLRYLKVSRD